MRQLPRPSPPVHRHLAGEMQAGLALVVRFGVVADQPKAIVNGTVALLMTLLPAALEREYDVPVDRWFGLWMTVPVFLDSFGSGGLYQEIRWGTI